MDIGGGQRVSMVTNERSISGEASSDINTLISSMFYYYLILLVLNNFLERAGEHLAELYTSTSEDPYKLDGAFTYINLKQLNHNNFIILRSFASTNNYRQLLIPGHTREEEENTEEGDSSTVHNYNASIQQNTRLRKPRKQRYRKAYVPSTISSASESRYFILTKYLF